MKLCTLLLMIFSVPLYSQIVCDSLTKEPIAFVNISDETGIGTVTNEKGLFSSDYFDDFEFLSFSHLTYTQKKVNVNEIENRDTIYLAPLRVYLNEVIVTNFTAKDTIVKAIDKITINYSFEPFNLYGFYRESIKEDHRGAALTEVSFVTYNRKGKKESEIYEAEIVQGRRTENHTTFGLDIIGGVANIVQDADMVRQKARMFDLNNLSKYMFNYLGNIESPSSMIYIIGFEPATNDIYNNNFGRLFVDSKTLAIIQIETEKDKEKVKRIIETLKPQESKSNNPKFMLLEASALIKYREINDKFYLSFVDISNTRKGVQKNKSYNYDINVKFILTNINNTNPRKLSTNYNLEKGFNEQVKGIPALADWKENNTLFFSDEEREILNDIKKFYD